ncbi:gliding motility-associated C-terminal domain-containing protein [Runella sp.]|uniref:T9SS type B sorting domain-containing protein n=1 Tax=Runella sp. TaxID=1960881 RepID=UPI003D0ED6D2
MKKFLYISLLLTVSMSGCHKNPISPTEECCDSEAVAININAQMGLWLPTVFSPNGDGTNDTFTIKWQNISTFGMTVLRNGLPVFKSNALETEWDGTINGSTPKKGVYVVAVSGKFETGLAFSQLTKIYLATDCLPTDEALPKCVFGDQLTNRGLTGVPTSDPVANCN